MGSKISLSSTVKTGKRGKRSTNKARRTALTYVTSGVFLETVITHATLHNKETLRWTVTTLLKITYRTDTIRN